jgi:hypothetical protein
MRRSVRGIAACFAVVLMTWCACSWAQRTDPAARDGDISRSGPNLTMDSKTEAASVSSVPGRRNGTRLASRTDRELIAAAGDRDSTRRSRAGNSNRESGRQDRRYTDSWKSQELNVLAIGMGVGDVDADGKNEVVLISPDTVYLYRVSDDRLQLTDEYSRGNLEFKSVDVASVRKPGPARIYVTAQNRGAISSFVLEFKNGKLVPVEDEFRYYLRVIVYPTHGPILLGQAKGLSKPYDGPIYRVEDKGDELEVKGRFGVPLKIPIFGFCIGDFEGNRMPLIAVYDRDDHLRIYDPSGKRLFLSRRYYGGSDVVLRLEGPEQRRFASSNTLENDGQIYFRPRLMSADLDHDGIYEILAIQHESATARVMSRTRMLREGSVTALVWNGDALETRWSTPKIQGMITDFTLDRLPGLPGLRLITVERKKTDWLSFLRSKSQVRSYDLNYLREKGDGRGKQDESR